MSDQYIFYGDQDGALGIRDAGAAQRGSGQAIDWMERAGPQGRDTGIGRAYEHRYRSFPEKRAATSGGWQQCRKNPRSAGGGYSFLGAVTLAVGSCMGSGCRVFSYHWY